MGAVVAELNSVIQQLNEWADGNCQRRAKQRFLISCGLRLIPLDSAGRLLIDELHIVAGKDLSTNGIAFFHMRPLDCARAIIYYSHPEAGPFAAEVEVKWSKPTAIGHFESGCSLVRKVPPCELRLGKHGQQL